MRRTSLKTAFVTVAALAAACGGEDRSTEGSVAVIDAGTGGTDGGSGGQSNGGTAGDSFAPPPCDGMVGLDNQQCPDQVVLPTAGAGGGLSTPSCVIQLEFEDFNPNMVNVGVDCEIIPFCPGWGDECWQFDDADQPTAIVLSEPVCARVTEEGFTVIDIMEGCRSIDL